MNIKEKIPAIITVIILILLFALACYFLFYQSTFYYTKVTNEEVETLDVTDDMRYQYTLIAYNKQGKEKEVTFKTSRKLKDDAYLELDVMMSRGVRSWAEISYDELPEAVQKKY